MDNKLKWNRPVRKYKTPNYMLYTSKCERWLIEKRPTSMPRGVMYTVHDRGQRVMHGRYGYEPRTLVEAKTYCQDIVDDERAAAAAS